MNIIEKIKEYYFLIRNKSVLFSIVYFFKDLVLFVLNSFFKVLKIEIYTQFKYPLTNFKFKVKLQDFYWKELQRGKVEINCFKYLKENIKKGQTILDIGAWIGTYTLLFSKLVEESGRVIAFEPDPTSYSILRKNIINNNLKNIKTENIGLSNFIGKSEFFIRGHGGDSTSSILFHNKSAININKLIINITSIDEYCELNGIRPDGIKIDVEGAEGLVIEGSHKIIFKYHPWILLEFHGHLMSEKQRNQTFRELSNLAKKIIFINSNDNSIKYQYGQILNKLPNFGKFNIIIET